MPKPWKDLPQHPERQPQTSELRTAILGTIAENNLLAVRENMHAQGYGLNVDAAGWIKRFFIEGLEWKASTWENLKSSDTSEPEAKSMWCSAFACFCYVQGHAKTGSPLYLKREGYGNALRDNLKKAGLFIPLASLYDGAKRPLATARLPGPGDFVVFNTGHIGLVKSFDHAGRKLVTYEGNTYDDPKARKDGVYEMAVSDRRLDTVQGFGICDPVPCPGGACGWDMEH